MKPLRDMLLIKLEAQKETTDSGLFIKKAWEGPSFTAEVLEAGPDADIKKGTRVVINPYAAIETGELTFIRAKDVLGYA